MKTRFTRMATSAAAIAIGMALYEMFPVAHAMPTTSTDLHARNAASADFEDIYLSKVTASSALSGYMVASAVGMAAGGFLVSANPRTERTVMVALILAGLTLVVLALGLVPAVLAAPVVGLAGFCSGVAAPSRDMLIRRVTAVRGQVQMRCSLRLRFDYGQTIPWVTRLPDGSGLCAIAGPDQVVLRSTVPLQGQHLTTEAVFEVKDGQTETFVLQHALSHEPLPSALDAEAALAYTEQWWRNWCAHCTYHGPWREAVLRSLIVLKALTYAPTGGIIAAPTTSLPEDPGGIRLHFSMGPEL